MVIYFSYFLIDGIVKLLMSGHTDNLFIQITESHAPSIKEIYFAKGKFSKSKINEYAPIILQKLEYIHNKNIIVRNLNPQTIHIEQENEPPRIYISDFFSAKKFRHIKSKKHIEYSDSVPFTGIPGYSSINAMKRREQSRRDDLESLGYIFLYMSLGTLPWSNSKCKTKKEKLQKIMDEKEKLKKTIKNLLKKGASRQVLIYLQRVKKLKFEEDPLYDNYISLFKNEEDDVIEEEDEEPDDQPKKSVIKKKAKTKKEEDKKDEDDDSEDNKKTKRKGSKKGKKAENDDDKKNNLQMSISSDESGGNKKKKMEKKVQMSDSSDESGGNKKKKKEKKVEMSISSDESGGNKKKQKELTISSDEEENNKKKKEVKSSGSDSEEKPKKMDKRVTFREDQPMVGDIISGKGASDKISFGVKGTGFIKESKDKDKNSDEHSQNSGSD